jgi:uncharacterized protein YjlB
MSWSKIKVMLVVFFEWKGIANHEFVPCEQLVNKQLYQDLSEHLRDAVRRNRPELWENQTWMLHHNNAPAHMLLLTQLPGKPSDIHCAPSILFSRLSPSRLFPVSKT